MKNLTTPDLALSHVAWGSWRSSANADINTPEKLAPLLEGCVAAGITTIDLADIYGGYKVEPLVGAALALTGIDRAAIQLVGKCDIKPASPARPEHRLKHYDTSPEHIRRTVANTLEALRTDYLDLLLLHRPDPLLDADAVAETLHGLLGSGRIRAVGVSNHLPVQLDLLQSRLEVPLVTNQIQCSPLHLEPLFDGTLDQAQRLRMRPMFWSPLAGGRLIEPKEEADRRAAAALDAIGVRMGGLGRDEVAIAWLATLPSRPVPILGSGNIERLERQAAAAKLRLDRQDWFAILEAARGEPVP